SSTFWNPTPANDVMNKTFKIIPTNDNPSGTYQITLYYTQAEVQGWQTATGQTLGSIQIVKVPTQISNVTPANPNGAGPVTVVTPVVGSLGTNTTLTFTFSNACSGLGAGAVGSALPIGLLDLN